jgi:hypothetical protein
MAVTWQTPAGSLGILPERILTEIQLSAVSDGGPVTFSVISGRLPGGLRLTPQGKIFGSPLEVRKYTESRFVIRAVNGSDLKDRTFSIAIDGADAPRWLTPEGFLNVGAGENYFVLDNAFVDFQLEADDEDISAGDQLRFYLAPNAGELPPGLILTEDGRITGFTDPIFSVETFGGVSGNYDAAGFDTLPLDRATAKSNGYDDFLYDNQTFDYNEPSQSPSKISRSYAFVVAVTDGINEERRLFRMWVVTEEFLQSDNSIIQVDTNLFRADNTGDRVPLWITESYLGRKRANNYVTIFLDVYDPPSLSGSITYVLLPNNPDGSASQPPPGLVLDPFTGELAGNVPYQAAVNTTYQFTMQAISFPSDLLGQRYNFRGTWNSTTDYLENDVVNYLGFPYIALQDHRNRVPTENITFWERGVSTADKTFTIDIIGEIESAIEWITDPDLGFIKPNQPSLISVKANSLLYGGRTAYEFVSGSLPPGLVFLATGDITGKVKQFADSAGPGLTRFFDRDSSTEDSTGTFSYDTVFDNGTTSFDQEFSFTIKAKDALSFAEIDRTFKILVKSSGLNVFANISLKALVSRPKRLYWFDFITNNEIFSSDEIYRFGDINFGIQSEPKILLYAGIESVAAVKYVQAISRNFYRKTIRLGDVRVAKAKDTLTQETIYETVYVEVVDELEFQGKSISATVELADNIESKVLVSYDAIKIDSDIPLVSDSDHQRIFPNSFKNMRRRIKDIGLRDREFLPLWMRSIQDNTFSEPGYVKALVIAYALPGFGDNIATKIRRSEFDFKLLGIEIDRILIDVVDGEIETKYFAFPQIGEKLP